MLRRIRLITEYDGTNYVGWQVQPNGISVQYEIERALKEITCSDIRVSASGRTDSGVHALAQVAHFDTDTRIPGDKFAFALNAHLPQDIRILNSSDVDSDFHSRFSVIRKHYRYIIRLSEHNSAFTRSYALHIHAPLDMDKIITAASLFLGEHDFLAFKSSGTHIKDTVRTIMKSEWTRDGDYLIYDVCGSGFLYNMVRIMVGTMLDIGRCTIPIENIEKALLTRDRSYAGATAPAHGLYLARVEYSDGFDTESITNGGHYGRNQTL